MKSYDLMIIGAGPAGIVACYHAVAAGLSVLLIEKGGKLDGRRELANGWFGHGLYANPADLAANENIARICQELPIKPPFTIRKIADGLYAHLESKADLVFKVEVKDISKTHEGFCAVSDRGSFCAKRCLIASGAKSAEWLVSMCRALGIQTNPNVKFGVRVEVPSKVMKSRNDNLSDNSQVCFRDSSQSGFVGEWESSGLLSAFGYTIPNKQSNRINFMAQIASDTDFFEAVKTAKIINVLSNDKVKRERVKDFLQGRSVLKHFSQFSPLANALSELDTVIPKFTITAVIYVPDIHMDGVLSAKGGMRTAVPGIYGAGNCISGIVSLPAAMDSAAEAVRSILEDKDNE